MLRRFLPPPARGRRPGGAGPALPARLPRSPPDDWDYTHHDFDDFLQPPSATHWFGTTQIGEDVYAQTLRGLQKSLIIGLLAALLSTGIAAVVGACAGYFGGWTDRVLMWFVDLLLVLPVLPDPRHPQPRLPRAAPGCSSWCCSPAFSWMITARVVRGLTLSLREREFVQAARFMGVPALRIIARHLLPNMSSLLIIDATLNVGGAILAETGAQLLRLRGAAARRLAGHADRRRHRLGAHLPLAVPLRRRAC